MKTYAGALALLRSYGGPWEVFKMRCFSAYITFEAYCLVARSKARAMQLAREASERQNHLPRTETEHV